MATLKDIESVSNGARFLNADLHIHSHGASHDVKDAAMTPEAIVDAAVRQGLSAIAITDHNSNQNVETAISYARATYPDKILVLPGVEVTTAHGHLLVYFAPDKTASLSTFLTRLELKGAMGDDNTRTAKSMSDAIAEAHKLDGICVAAHIDRDKTGFDKFAPGFQNWKKDIITSPGLYGLECDDPAALAWYSEKDKAGPDSVERKKMLRARMDVGELKARYELGHLQGSDSHSMKQFEHPDPTKRWTRIKMAELSFDALRVALVDSTARVRARVSIPLSISRIRGVSFVGGFLDGQTINFSDNLNCLIGGRGTGKSTAVRAVAYAFGINDEFGEFDNCPDTVTVYTQDDNGILYRHMRVRGAETDAKALQGGKVMADVPTDAFRIEYFGQGELAKVAENPLKNPQLLQEFLDRHTNLSDLTEKETTLVAALKENAGRLQPLEDSFGQLKGKKKLLSDIEAKLKVADEGNLRGIVGTQSKLASEKLLRESVETIITEFNAGYSLSSMERDFDDLLATAGACTEDAASQGIVAQMKALVETNNAAVKKKEKEINAVLKSCATELSRLTQELKTNGQRIGVDIAAKVADLKARGLASDMKGLNELLRQKTAVAGDIAAIEKRSAELKRCRKEREDLRAILRDVRDEMSARRKAQLQKINEGLAATIKDYKIFVSYDDAGITSEFEAFMQEKMTGTYLQDGTIESLCSNISPSELADLILQRDSATIAATGEVSDEWAETITNQLCYWGILFELQGLSKPPKPIINILTRATPPKQIPVFQLSDGQRHTILLAIAMLADSNVPLVIDQPEDDLDNAFVFSSIVATLREVKERRQVVIVTHNANIAVLGDSELILPMYRVDDCGHIKDRGSIDSAATKKCVQEILEGGEEAFLRRKEIYDH